MRCVRAFRCVTLGGVYCSPLEIGYVSGLWLNNKLDRENFTYSNLGGVGGKKAFVKSFYEITSGDYDLKLEIIIYFQWSRRKKIGYEFKSNP